MSMTTFDWNAIFADFSRGIPRELHRHGQHIIVLNGFVALCVIPAVISAILGRSPSAWLTWWPSACLVVALSVCMATDYFSRPLWTRVAIVLLCTIGYFAIALPLYELFASKGLGVDKLGPGHGGILWAMMRGAAGSVMLSYGLRRSYLMADWAKRSAKDSTA